MGVLYADFAQVIEYDNRLGKGDRWLLDGKRPKLTSEILAKYPDAKVRRPKESICMEWEREPFKYGIVRPEAERMFDIVIHARSMTKYGQSDRNWPLKRYEKVVAHFAGKRIVCIGSPMGAMFVPGTTDARGIDLVGVVNTLANAKVLLSPSSGPAHLASFCGCPHVVMADDKVQKQIGTTNRKRYEKLWNPLRTPCTILDEDNWQPSVKTVTKAMEAYL
jgi:hypothetical protein